MDIKELIESVKDANAIYENLTIEHIADIFNVFLECPDYESCDNCKLNNNKIGCFKLRDIAMKKVVDMNTSIIKITENKGEPQCQK